MPQELSALKTSQAVFPMGEGKLHCRGGICPAGEPQSTAK
jgi:hypothetical protein